MRSNECKVQVKEYHSRKYVEILEARGNKGSSSTISRWYVTKWGLNKCKVQVKEYHSRKYVEILEARGNKGSSSTISRWYVTKWGHAWAHLLVCPSTWETEKEYKKLKCKDGNSSLRIIAWWESKKQKVAHESHNTKLGKLQGIPSFYHSHHHSLA